MKVDVKQSARIGWLICMADSRFGPIRGEITGPSLPNSEKSRPQLRKKKKWGGEERGGGGWRRVEEGGGGQQGSMNN